MMQPLGDRVLIKLDAAVTKTASGLFIPDSAQTRLAQGEVLAVGPDAQASLQVGKRVMFDQYAVNKISEDTILVGIGACLAIID